MMKKMELLCAYVYILLGPVMSVWQELKKIGAAVTLLESALENYITKIRKLKKLIITFVNNHDSFSRHSWKLKKSIEVSRLKTQTIVTYFVHLFSFKHMVSKTYTGTLKLDKCYNNNMRIVLKLVECTLHWQSAVIGTGLDCVFVKLTSAVKCFQSQTNGNFIKLIEIR